MDRLLELRTAIKTEAKRLGFSHLGIAPALPVPLYQQYMAWVQSGYHASMGYLAREDTLEKRANPQLILEGCQRILCLAMAYRHPQVNNQDSAPGKGRISSYARTRDYHQVIWEKLAQLEEFIHSHTTKNTTTKSYVDTGPILERSFAALAGIGIAGKNSCLLIQGKGSYFFLAEILTNLELPVDTPATRDLCGSCNRCIEACPTGCILPNRTIDARRCISYLTIENKAIIPNDLKEQIGSWVFGCDVCQIVCPHNARTTKQPAALGEPILPEYLDLIELFSDNTKSFALKFGRTPLTRTKRSGLLRNAAVALGNQKLPQALPVLKTALTREQDPIILDACRWAIQNIKQSI